MQKVKICSVLIKQGNLSFQYHYPVLANITISDTELLKPIGNQICSTLSKYINITSEEVIFSSYYANESDLRSGNISMDIDSLINRRMTENERKILADCSAKVMQIISKYYKV